MVMTYPYANKVADILERSKKDVLDTLQESIANINEETESEKKKEFITNFIDSCNKLRDKYRTNRDFIETNCDADKFRSECQNSFKDLMMIISLFDECQDKSDLKYDTFTYLASSYGIRHSEALALYAAVSLDIEAMRSFAQSHMNLIRLPAST